MADQPDDTPLDEPLEEGGVEPSADPGEGPDVTELDDDPAYNPQEPGLKEEKGG